MSRTEDNFTITASIDTRGQSTAWSILCTEQAVDELEPGQVLEVSLSDPQLAIDLPRILQKRGEVLLASRQGDEGLRLYVRRGAHYPDQPITNKTQRRKNMSQLLNETPSVASSVDARGSACPGPLLEAKKAIASVMVGEVLEVLSNDPGTKDDIPVWATKVGHEYLGHAEADGYERIFVRRQK
jgi:tRNA 2-thiouridine synthesizing protein A